MFNVDHYAISVSNIEKSIDFYKKLDFSVIKDWISPDKGTHIVHMMNGNLILEMFCYQDCRDLPEFVNNLGTDLKTMGSKHLGLWVNDLNLAAKYLVDKGVLSSMPSIVPGRLGRPYFFIKDPDGIFVEIIDKR